MLDVGQEVNTKYGVGVVMAGGAPRRHVYVRIHSNSQIYVLNSSEVSAVESARGQSRASAFVPSIAAIASQSFSASLPADRSTSPWRGRMKKRRHIKETPLSIFVRARLTELGLKQSEFCRLTGFDQGLLSKIQSSMINKLNLETVLRLAAGLSVPPQKILELIGRPDLNELIVKAYSGELPEPPDTSPTDGSDVVGEISRLAGRAHAAGRDLGPVLEMLEDLTAQEQTKSQSAGESTSDAG